MNSPPDDAQGLHQRHALGRHEALADLHELRASVVACRLAAPRTPKSRCALVSQVPEDRVAVKELKLNYQNAEAI